MRNAGILSYDATLESIDFQGNAFHKALTEAIKSCYSVVVDKSKNRTKQSIELKDILLNDKAKIIHNVKWYLFKDYEKELNLWYEDKAFVKIIDIIREFTNINIKLKHTRNTAGMAVQIPFLVPNHIFWHNELKQTLIDYDYNFANDSDMKKVLSAMKTKMLDGSVSNKDSKVHGVYERMEAVMHFPIQYFLDENTFTAEEVAGIMLHEIGHVYTTFEMVDRLVTTNQVLAGVSRALDKSVTSEQRKVIFTTASSILKMTKDQQEALDKSKDYNQLSVIVLDASVQLSISELGKSVYDVNSCEQLADQFCNRHGGGRHVVTALDKVHKSYSLGGELLYGKIFSMYRTFIAVVSFVLFLITFTMSSFMFLYTSLLIFVIAANMSDEIYDRPATRFNRIRLDNIENLKDKDLDKEEKIRLIEDNKTIDRILKVTSDYNGIVSIFAYYLKPSYRNAQKYNNLQKELEKLSSNDLFQASAKLSTV